MRLRAEAAEERAVPRDHVVRVEPVEPRGLCASDEGRVPEDADVVERRERLGPLGGRVTVGVVDVEVREAALAVEPRDVLRRLGRRPAAIGLHVDRDLEPVARRLLLHEKQAVVLG